MADTLNSGQQLLVLKVMRLARPKLAPSATFSLDPCDPTGYSDLVKKAYSSKFGEENIDVPIGEYLVTPQMFENIHLGETFTFYVSCVNESSYKVLDVSVKCDLQTNTQRSSLPCSLSELGMEPGQSCGQVISHEVKELGQHILICSVNYKTEGDEKMYFRKFFKFPVTKPIDVKTKFYNAEDSSNNDVYLEAQIENTSSEAMVLEKVDLEPSSYYTVTPIGKTSPTEDGVCSPTLKPNDIRQFLFCLSTLKDSKLVCFKDMTVIGRLDMSWRTSMGERGRLQTSNLQRISPGYGDIRLIVEELPAVVRVRKPFLVKLKVHNCSERALDLCLMLVPPNTCSFVFCSVSGASLGQLPPNAAASFSLEILPFCSGFQTITGIRLVDANMKRTYEHDDVAQIFVS